MYWRKKKSLTCNLSLVEKEDDITDVSDWKEGKDCYACQCSLKKSLKSCAEKQWRWTDKSQMQLKDDHDGDAGFSEIREVIVLQGSQPNRRSVYTGRGQLWFFYHSVCVIVAEEHGVKERVSQIWDWIISDFSGLALQLLSAISKN